MSRHHRLWCACGTSDCRFSSDSKGDLWREISARSMRRFLVHLRHKTSALHNFSKPRSALRHLKSKCRVLISNCFQIFTSLINFVSGGWLTTANFSWKPIYLMKHIVSVMQRQQSKLVHIVQTVIMATRHKSTIFRSDYWHRKPFDRPAIMEAEHTTDSSRNNFGWIA